LPAAHLCPRTFAGLRFDSPTCPSAQAPQLQTCARQSGFTCCASHHDRALRGAHAACLASGAAPGCCAELAALSCRACDGAAALGLAPSAVCGTACARLARRCRRAFFAFDEAGRLAPCAPGSLVCARLGDILARDAGEAEGGGVAEAEAEGAAEEGGGTGGDGGGGRAGNAAGGAADRAAARDAARAAPLCERLGFEVARGAGEPCFSGAELAAPPPGFDAPPANATCRQRERRVEPNAEERAAARAAAAAAAAAAGTRGAIVAALRGLPPWAIVAAAAALAAAAIAVWRQIDRSRKCEAGWEEEGEAAAIGALGGVAAPESAEELRQRRLARFAPPSDSPASGSTGVVVGATGGAAATAFAS